MDIDQSLLLVLFAIVASIFGSMLGLGGGVFIVPLYTLVMGIDPKIAIGASAIAVVTNSVVSSSRHLRNRYVNVRLAMLLEITTAIGAIIGALIAIVVSADFLKALLGVVLLYASYSMLRGRKIEISSVPPDEPDPLELMASYPERGETIRYVPRKTEFGLSVSWIAGMLSGMLGIGGGIVQVPVLNRVMKVPLRAAAGTNSFMIGMTSVATAAVFYAAGNIDPTVAVPAMVGTLIGSSTGSALTKRVKTDHLIVIFVLIMVYVGASMIYSSRFWELFT